MMTKVVAASDVVITTAAIPGKQVAGPGHRRTWSRGMAPGSVIVDLAAERGGNCELTQADETVVDQRRDDLRSHEPAVHGAVSRQSDVREERHDVPHAPREGQAARRRPDDEITRETLVTRDGQVVHERLKPLVEHVSSQHPRLARHSA